MSDSKGWLKVYRTIQNHFLWDEKPFDRARAWIDLLLTVNHEDRRIVVNGSVIVVGRGQWITSTRRLADRWGWSKDKVVRFLRVLEQDGMVDINKDSSRTLLTIVNYSKYQDTHDSFDDSDEDEDKDSGETVARQSPDKNKNDKNDKNEKKIIKPLLRPVTEDRSESIQRILDKWNGLEDIGICSLSRIMVGSKRYESLRARLAEYGEEKVMAAIDRIRGSDFLVGKNTRGWKITFDWFVLPNNFPKVLEGNYDRTGDPKKSKLDFSWLERLEEA